MKIFLKALLLFGLLYQVYSQGATCESATCLHVANGIPGIQWNGLINGDWSNQDIYGNNFPMNRPNTCLYSLDNNNWFYLKIKTAGVLSLIARSANDIDVIIFGPFSGARDFGGINSGGQGQGASSFSDVKTHCGVLERHHIVDCGSGSNNIEPIHIPYSHVGDFYLLNILGDGSAAQISMEKSGGLAETFCDDWTCHYSCGTCFGPGINQCTSCPDSALFDTHHRLGHAGYDGTCPCDDGYVDGGNQNCIVDECTLRMMSVFFERNVLTAGFAFDHQYHCNMGDYDHTCVEIFGMTCDDQCDCTNFPHVVTCDISDQNYGPCQSNLDINGSCSHCEVPCTPTFGQKVHPWDFPPRIISIDRHSSDTTAGGGELVLTGYWFPQCPPLRILEENKQEARRNMQVVDATFLNCFDNPKLPNSPGGFKTLQECSDIAIAAGGSIIGMQWPQGDGNFETAECFWGNNANFYDAISSKPCTGWNMAGEAMGGPNENGVYTLPPPAAPVVENPPPPSQGTYTFNDCYATNLPNQIAGQLTLDECKYYAQCQGATIIGMQWPQGDSSFETAECRWGDDSSINLGATVPCTGFNWAGDAVGGPSENAVYTNPTVLSAEEVFVCQPVYMLYTPLPFDDSTNAVYNFDFPCTDGPHDYTIMGQCDTVECCYNLVDNDVPRKRINTCLAIKVNPYCNNEEGVSIIGCFEASRCWYMPLGYPILGGPAMGVEVMYPEKAGNCACGSGSDLPNCCDDSSEYENGCEQDVIDACPVVVDGCDLVCADRRRRQLTPSGWNFEDCYTGNNLPNQFSGQITLEECAYHAKCSGGTIIGMQWPQGDGNNDTGECRWGTDEDYYSATPITTCLTFNTQGDATGGPGYNAVYTNPTAHPDPSSCDPIYTAYTPLPFDDSTNAVFNFDFPCTSGPHDYTIMGQCDTVECCYNLVDNDPMGRKRINTCLAIIVNPYCNNEEGVSIIGCFEASRCFYMPEGYPLLGGPAMGVETMYPERAGQDCGCCLSTTVGNECPNCDESSLWTNGCFGGCEPDCGPEPPVVVIVDDGDDGECACCTDPSCDGCTEDDVCCWNTECGECDNDPCPVVVPVCTDPSCVGCAVDDVCCWATCGVCGNDPCPPPPPPSSPCTDPACVGCLADNACCWNTTCGECWNDPCLCTDPTCIGCLENDVCCYNTTCGMCDNDPCCPDLPANQDTFVNVGFANANIIACNNQQNSLDDTITVIVPPMDQNDVECYPVYVTLGQENCPHFGDYPDHCGNEGDGVTSHVCNDCDFTYGPACTFNVTSTTVEVITEFQIISYSWDNPITSCGEHTFTFAFANAEGVDSNDVKVTMSNTNPERSIVFDCSNANCNCSNFPWVMICTELNENLPNGRWDFTCSPDCGVSNFLVPHDNVPEIWAQEENEDNVNGNGDSLSNSGSNASPDLDLWVNCWGADTEAYTRRVTMGQDNFDMLRSYTHADCNAQVDFPSLPSTYMEGTPIWIECHSDEVSHAADYPHSNNGVSSHATRVGMFRYGDPMDHTVDAAWSSPQTSHSSSPDGTNAWTASSSNIAMFSLLTFMFLLMI